MHLRAAHPGYLDVHQITSHSNSEGSKSGLWAQDISSPPSQPHPLPSKPTSPVCKKPKKKHCQYRFSFTKGFSLSYDSIDMATPTDHEDYCINTDSEDSRSTKPTSSTPVSPKCPYIKDLWDEDVDHDPFPTSPIPSPCPESPSSPAFTIRSETPADRKKVINEKNQHYSRIYHPELNSM